MPLISFTDFTWRMLSQLRPLPTLPTDLPLTLALAYLIHLNTRSMIGALQYLTFTHPDLAFSVHQLFQFMQLPIWRLPSVFCAMLEALYILAQISLQVLLLSQPFQMQIGLGTLLIGSLQLVCWSSLAPIQFCGPPRSIPQFLILPLRQNIVLWSQQLLNCPGFVPCSSSFVCIFITFQSFGVITSLQLPQLPILFCIPRSSTLKLIITLFERRLSVQI